MPFATRPLLGASIGGRALKCIFLIQKFSCSLSPGGFSWLAGWLCCSGRYRWNLRLVQLYIVSPTWKMKKTEHDKISPTRLLFLLWAARLLVHPELTSQIVSADVPLPGKVFQSRSKPVQTSDIWSVCGQSSSNWWALLFSEQLVSCPLPWSPSHLFWGLGNEI